MKKLLLFGIGISLFIAIALSLQRKPAQAPVSVVLAPTEATNAPKAQPVHRHADTEQPRPKPYFAPEPGEPSIRGLSIPAYNHVEATKILVSNRKDDPAMQIVASTLITNGIDVGYSWLIYKKLRLVAEVRKQQLIDPTPPGKFSYVDSVIAGVKGELSQGIKGSPPVPPEKMGIIVSLLQNAPTPLESISTTQPWPSNFTAHTYPDVKIPKEKYLTPADILQYFREHPAPAQ